LVVSLARDNLYRKYMYGDAGYSGLDNCGVPIKALIILVSHEKSQEKQRKDA